MSRLTAIVNAIVASLLMILLWIEYTNTHHTPVLLDRFKGLGAIAAPYIWLSSLGYFTRRHVWPTAITMCASFLVGTLAVWILSNNTSYTPIGPNTDYRSEGASIVLIGQIIFTTILTPVILLSYLFSVSCSRLAKVGEPPTSP